MILKIMQLKYLKLYGSIKLITIISQIHSSEFKQFK